jgi:hypothetical protein
MIDVTTLDVTDSRESGAKPKLHTNGTELHEEDLILCKTDLTDTKWYLTEINKIYSGEVEIIYFTTPIKVAENYSEQSIAQRSENLRSARFRKTWFIRDGKNVGKGTINGYPGRYYAVLRNTAVIPARFLEAFFDKLHLELDQMNGRNGKRDIKMCLKHFGWGYSDVVLPVL